MAGQIFVVDQPACSNVVVNDRREYQGSHEGCKAVADYLSNRTAPPTPIIYYTCPPGDCMKMPDVWEERR